jgi:hypothetical protein
MVQSQDLSNAYAIELLRTACPTPGNLLDFLEGGAPLTHTLRRIDQPPLCMFAQRPFGLGQKRENN